MTGGGDDTAYMWDATPPEGPLLPKSYETNPQPQERQGQNIEDFPHVKRWLETMLARPAVLRGIKVSSEDRNKTDLTDPAVQAVLFGQKAR